MNEQQLAQVYQMVDNIPFSRQKKNIGRDFSDGLMMAELVHYYYPKRVQLHNYPSTNTNWNTLNTKVLKKLGINVSSQEIQQIANVKAMAIQKVLYRFLIKFEKPEEEVKVSNRFENNYTQREIQNSHVQNQPAGSGLGLSFPNKKGQVVSIKKQQQDTEQVLDLIDKIDYAYAQMIKLQQMSRLKDDVIKNLEKKVQKIIFN